MERRGSCRSSSLISLPFSLSLSLSVPFASHVRSSRSIKRNLWRTAPNGTVEFYSVLILITCNNAQPAVLIGQTELADARTPLLSRCASGWLRVAVIRAAFGTTRGIESLARLLNGSGKSRVRTRDPRSQESRRWPFPRGKQTPAASAQVFPCGALFRLSSITPVRR